MRLIRMETTSRIEESRSRGQYESLQSGVLLVIFFIPVKPYAQVDGHSEDDDLKSQNLKLNTQTSTDRSQTTSGWQPT